MNAQSLVSSNIQLHETIQVFITNDTILSICVCVCVYKKNGSTMWRDGLVSTQRNTLVCIVEEWWI